MSELRVRVIDQDTERLWAETTIFGLTGQVSIDIEVEYPDGQTVRYSRQID